MSLSNTIVLKQFVNELKELKFWGKTWYQSNLEFRSTYTAIYSVIYSLMAQTIYTVQTMERVSVSKEREGILHALQENSWYSFIYLIYL